MASCLGFLLAVGVFFQVVRFSGGSAFQVGAFPLERGGDSVEVGGDIFEEKEPESGSFF